MGWMGLKADGPLLLSAIEPGAAAAAGGCAATGMGTGAGPGTATGLLAPGRP
jgi:hypothetical protein